MLDNYTPVAVAVAAVVDVDGDGSVCLVDKRQFAADKDGSGSVMRDQVVEVDNTGDDSRQVVVAAAAAGLCLL